MVSFLTKQIYKQKQLVKYGISGGIAFSTDLALLYFFTGTLNVWYLFSAVLAFIIAFFVSFFLQKFWTFRDVSKQGIYKQMAQYFVIGLINLWINTMGMFLLVDLFSVMYILAQIIMSASIAIGSFIIYKFVIFKRVRKKENKKIKNILLATGIFPPDIGGPATMLEALARDLIKNGFQVKILTYADNDQKSDKEFEVFRINKNKKYKNIFFLYNMYKLSDWADVVYTTDTYSVGYFTYLMKKYLGKKYVLRFAGDSAWEVATAQGLIDDYIVDFQFKKYNEEIERLKDRRDKIMKNADMVIAVSDFMKDLAIKIGVQEEKIKTIYNSIDFIKESVSEEKVREIKTKYGQNSKVIMTACRLTPWKGIDGIIRIIPKLKEKFGNVNFLILGEGEEKNDLINLARKLSVEDDVCFLGKIEHKEMLNYYKSADVFVLNTNYEGLSHTLLEVMKAGTPIVTTNIGGNPEVVENGENGFLVEYNNEDQLLKACEAIFIDMELQNKFIQNSKKKLEKFKWENTVNETINILNKYV